MNTSIPGIFGFFWRKIFVSPSEFNNDTLANPSKISNSEDKSSDFIYDTLLARLIAWLLRSISVIVKQNSW